MFIIYVYSIYVYSATEFPVVPDGYTGLKGPTSELNSVILSNFLCGWYHFNV